MPRKRGGGFGQGQHRSYKSSGNKTAIEKHIEKMAKERAAILNEISRQEYEATLHEIERIKKRGVRAGE